MITLTLSMITLHVDYLHIQILPNDSMDNNNELYNWTH